MAKLPRDKSYTDVIKALRKIGSEIVKTGPHYILVRNGREICVPAHKELKPGTLKSIIRQAGLSTEEFLQIDP